MPRPHRPRKGEPVRLAAIAASRRLAAGRGPLGLLSGWQRAAGPMLSRRCRPVGLEGAALRLEVPDAIWAAEIGRNEPRLIAALQACGLRVRAIRCRIGGAVAVAAPASTGRPAAVPETAAGGQGSAPLRALIARLRGRGGPSGGR